MFLPLKVFFVLIVVAIGLLLAVWRDRIDTHYRELVPRLERGVIIGAFAMLFWPAMDYGYQQTANVLFGRADAGPQLRLSLVIAPWALLLLFYFLRRLGKQGELIGQISGVIVAGVAVLRYEQLNDWVGRLFGERHGREDDDRADRVCRARPHRAPVARNSAASLSPLHLRVEGARSRSGRAGASGLRAKAQCPTLATGRSDSELGPRRIREQRARC